MSVAALLLAVSLFLDWYRPYVSGWSAFEALDVVLAGIAIAALAAGTGLARVSPAAILGLSAIAFAIVASQLLQEPPSAAGQAPGTGAWMALGATTVLVVAALLRLGQISLTVVLTAQEEAPTAVIPDEDLGDEGGDSNPRQT